MYLIHHIESFDEGAFLIYTFEASLALAIFDFDFLAIANFSNYFVIADSQFSIFSVFEPIVE